MRIQEASKDIEGKGENFRMYPKGNFLTFLPLGDKDQIASWIADEVIHVTSQVFGLVQSCGKSRYVGLVGE